MVKFRGSKEAFGKPGIDPRWARGNKEGVGTAYSGDSRLWFTIWNGYVTEIFYPTIDLPQLRDLQYLISDGKSFFHEEKRTLKNQIERLATYALGYRVTSSDPEGRYQIVKEIISTPHLPCLMEHVRIEGDESFISTLNLYVLCAPHLSVGGKHNNGYVIEVEGKAILVAERNGMWLALGANVPFSKLSCGYVGESDGWTDLANNYQMDWEFDQALDGNIALTGEIQLGQKREFTLVLAFGRGLQNAISNLLQALAIPFQKHLEKFITQWTTPIKHPPQLIKSSQDQGNLACVSLSILKAHEDKNFPGALIASLSIPWGEKRGDEDFGAYHLVWTRDLVQIALGMLASDNSVTPLRALIYLAASQREDGGFYKNFWVDGREYSKGIQLDEVAFPILLAFRLAKQQALLEFDPYFLVKQAAQYLIKQGPITRQDRWEEDIPGYSPSTLAIMITALICAAHFARERGELVEASYFEDFADFLECHIEQWTVTTEGTLDPNIPCHYIRINPTDLDTIYPKEDANHGRVLLFDRLPNEPREYPAKEILDAGFLELVRYGIRRANDPIIVDSLRLVDRFLKVETPYGPCWRRYSHDGYGQRDDGSPYQNGGRGRAWPLLTGERGHYELAAGQDVTPFIRAIEGFAEETGLIPEQIWDAPDIPEAHMFLGRSTGAARPLAWAHAEYIRLLRSVLDGKVFDKIADVEERYLSTPKKGRQIEIWEHHYQTQKVKKGSLLRIQAREPFHLRWSIDNRQTFKESDEFKRVFNIYFMDIAIEEGSSITFSFYWPEKNSREEGSYTVSIFSV